MDFFVILYKIFWSIGTIVVVYAIGILGPLLSLEKNTSLFGRIWAFCFIGLAIIVIIGVLFDIWSPNWRI